MYGGLGVAWIILPGRVLLYLVFVLSILIVLREVREHGVHSKGILRSGVAMTYHLKGPVHREHTLVVYDSGVDTLVMYELLVFGSSGG